MRVTSHLNLQALFCCKNSVKTEDFIGGSKKKSSMYMNFSQKGSSNVFHRITPFTEHRGGYENDTASPADTGR